VPNETRRRIVFLLLGPQQGGDQGQHNMVSLQTNSKGGRHADRPYPRHCQNRPKGRVMQMEGATEEASRDCERLHLEGYDEGRQWILVPKVANTFPDWTNTNKNEAGKGA
jgi:hypothetical protein